MPGATRAILQALCMPGIVTLFPAIESLRGDIKVATGEVGIVIMRIIVIKPLESLSGLLR